MPEFDFFAAWYGKASIGAILAFVIWKVYHDMKHDKKAVVAKVEKIEEKHDNFVTSTFERTLKALEGNASTRKELTIALNRLSKSHETLPCNQVRGEAHKFRTPRDGTEATPPEGSPQ